ncbi:hypothetical protein KO566_00230 [Flavobacteriaceae bacterium XHP0103]|uniref:hypothetical protein n=1 Tax=Marixanthotalea marina TaxID=2844359 RepID=UPI002989CF7B|nr:hypothetical protein [Marixanthotalea marina]MBU3820471.1 hypothetical protein [Marixanthotalea marina]
MKMLLNFIGILLLTAVQSFASETKLPVHCHTDNLHSETAEKNLIYVDYASIPESITLTSQWEPLQLQETSFNNGWAILKAYGKQFSSLCKQYLINCKDLFVNFNTSDIIFPFHLHW